MINSSNGRKSREHRRYLSIGEKEEEGGGIFSEDGVDGGEEDGGGGGGGRGSRGLESQAYGVAHGGGEDAVVDDDDDDDDDGNGRRVDGISNVAVPSRDTSGFGGMTKLGSLGNSRTGMF